jgi:tetratricopeptide (TPR) repeat protein
MVRGAHICVALLLVACLPHPASAKWTLLQSDHFTFVGDASERQIRRVAQKLEQFREVVARVVPSAGTASPVPTVVFVFADQRAFRPYTPRYQGRAVDVAGYLAGSTDRAFIALTVEPDIEELAFTTVFHEYAHFLTASAGITLPPWASEGLAGVWETVQERDGGRVAVVGRASSAHVELLRESTLIPLSDLRAVTHDSTLYNEGSRRSVFYAQSWALMHYLMLGNPARAVQLQSFIAAIRTNVAPEQAFVDAFGDDRVLQRELFEYIRKFTFPAMRYEFDAKIETAVTARGSTLADAEAAGFLGDLLAGLGREDEARVLLDATLKSTPQAVRPAVSRAVLDLREGKLQEAAARLEEILTRAPDDQGALEALGQTLFERQEQQPDPAVLLRARDVLTRVAALDSAAPHALAMLASLHLRRDGDPARAVALLDRAARLAPARHDYRLMAAEGLIRLGELERATSFLGPLVGGGRTPEIRDTARRLLALVASMRIEKAARTSIDAPATPPAPAPPPAEPTTSSPAASSRPPAAPAPRYILDLRPVGVGEARVLGLFRGIECEPTGVAIVIDADGNTRRFGAQRLDAIEFISYRSQDPGSVSCGPLASPVRAFATYRPGSTAAPATDGVAVAVELLPDGYTPR